MSLTVPFIPLYPLTVTFLFGGICIFEEPIFEIQNLLVKISLMPLKLLFNFRRFQILHKSSYKLSCQHQILDNFDNFQKFLTF